MRKPLTPLADLLQSVLPALSPLAPRTVPLAEAQGQWLAALLRAPRAEPEHAVALVSGLAVTALNVVGASPHSPVMLDCPPIHVSAGVALPEGADAIIDESAVTSAGPLALVTEAVAPGCNARLSGQDAPNGAVIVPTGVRLAPEALLACRLAGIEFASVRSPCISVGVVDPAPAAWLNDRLKRLGCRIAEPGGPHDVAIMAAQADEPRLALQPGPTAWISRDADNVVTIEVPRRFDGLVAAHAALVLPVIARLLDVQPRHVAMPLKRKIASQIGMSELALLRMCPDGFDVLAIGDVTLAAVAGSNAFAIIPAGSEGFAAGESIAAMPIEEPLHPGH